MTTDRTNHFLGQCPRCDRTFSCDESGTIARHGYRIEWRQEVNHCPNGPAVEITDKGLRAYVAELEGLLPDARVRAETTAAANEAARLAFDAVCEAFRAGTVTSEDRKAASSAWKNAETAARRAEWFLDSLNRTLARKRAQVEAWEPRPLRDRHVEEIERRRRTEEERAEAARVREEKAAAKSARKAAAETKKAARFAAMRAYVETLAVGAFVRIDDLRKASAAAGEGRATENQAYDFIYDSEDDGRPARGLVGRDSYGNPVRR